MRKFIFEDMFDEKNAMIEKEDGGCAMIATISDDDETGVFIRVQSWDDNKEHEDFKSLIGKKVRITIEVIE